MAIQVAPNYNNVGALQNLVPEPRLSGIIQGRAFVAGNRALRYDGTMRCDLLFGFALDSSLSTYWDDFVYNNILTQLGLANADYAFLTMALPNNRTRQNVNYNCVSNLPDLPAAGEWDRKRLFPLRISITGIVAI